ncbi:hypothetical protein BDV93DRAFT_525174 [Ceratobasidium sp. AG-I]|nr:hypothetical protein BDV93DRAFT_525174 [Ceratobasidium sp. AG-I]
MRLDDKPETIQTVMSFFDRSNIVRLCVNGYSVKDRLPVLLCRLPKLRELVLQNYEISQQEFFDLKTAKQMIADNLTLWPQLQAWHLLNCRIDWDALCGMVCTHNLTKLRLRDCYLDPVWPSNEDRDLGLLVEVLGEVVPDILCSRISSERTGGLAPK